MVLSRIQYSNILCNVTSSNTNCLNTFSIRRFMKISQNLRWPFPFLESLLITSSSDWAAMSFPIIHIRFTIVSILNKFVSLPCVSLLFFKDFFNLLMRNTEKEAEREAGSLWGAQCKTPSQDPGFMTWAKGRHLTTGNQGAPPCLSFLCLFFSHFLSNIFHMLWSWQNLGHFCKPCNILLSTLRYGLKFMCLLCMYQYGGLKTVFTPEILLWDSPSETNCCYGFLLYLQTK